MKQSRFTVAIDGPAAAGKGTISKAVAEHFGFAHLDTGLLYRAVGRKALDAGLTEFSAEKTEGLARGLSAADLTRGDLRTAEVAQAASRVALIPEVRAALVEFQREFSHRDGGAVLDGRDIGTVICPDADVKLFVTASAEVRAERRFKELSAKDRETTFKKVLADVVARDARDADRNTAPMVAALDAVVLDTSAMSIDAAVHSSIDIIDAKFGGF
ncbi:MAG: (d)CMP kinase [Rhodobacteraceae bacterium]|nr:(d)CMP kinase [Paracoccaceae bacterium]